MSLDINYIERCFHEALQELFLQAKEQGVDGELSMTIRAYGALNSGQLKIETTVEIGSWSVGKGVMTAVSLEPAMSIAKARYYDNRAFQPKLLTIERPARVAPVEVEEDEVPF